MRRRSGFTLIELLVVIAIIALLLSVIMPSLQKAKDGARFAICKSNIKQITVAGITYGVNNRDQLPPHIALNINQTGYSWPNSLLYNMADTWAGHPMPTPGDRRVSKYLGPYLSEGEIFHCPFSPARHRERVMNTWKWYPGGPYPSPETGICSYGMYWNYSQGKFSGDYLLKGPKRLAEASSRSLLVSDMIAYSQTMYLSNHRHREGIYTPIGGMWTIPGALAAAPIGQDIKYNYGFGDGHVDMTRGSDLVSTTVMDINNILIYLPASTMTKKRP